MSDKTDEGVSEEELDEFLAKGNKYDVAYLSALSTRDLQRKVLKLFREDRPSSDRLQREIEASMHITAEDWQSRCNVTSIY